MIINLSITLPTDMKNWIKSSCARINSRMETMQLIPFRKHSHFPIALKLPLKRTFVVHEDEIFHINWSHIHKDLESRRVVSKPQHTSLLRLIYIQSKTSKILLERKLKVRTYIDCHRNFAANGFQGLFRRCTVFEIFDSSRNSLKINLKHQVSKFNLGNFQWIIDIAILLLHWLLTAVWHAWNSMVLIFGIINRSLHFAENYKQGCHWKTNHPVWLIKFKMLWIIFCFAFR